MPPFYHGSGADILEHLDAETSEPELYASAYFRSTASDYDDFYNYDPADPACEEQYELAMEDYYERIYSATNGSESLLSWRYDDEGKSPTVTFNASKKGVWEKAQVELNALRENIMDKAGVDCISSYDPVTDTLKLFFGEQKSLAHLLASTLSLSRAKTLRFLATYCFQKQHGKSTPNLYKAGSGLDTTGLMGEDEYLACWRLIDSAGASGTKRRQGAPLWEKFQDRLNETTVELYMCHDEYMLIAVDDDKRNAELKSGRDQQGLKSAVHDAKKRAGVVGHTAVSVLAMVTLAVMWEKEGDTQHDCYMRCVERIFGSGQRLDRVTFASDRGYWIRKLLEKLIELGADIEGTFKRSPLMPFTCEQKIGENDPRKLMSTEGPATLHRATTTVHGKTLCANYSTTGTGKGVLTASTVHTDQHIEVVVDEAKRISTKIDDSATEDQRRARLFRHVASNSEDSSEDEAALIDSVLGALPVEHVVEYQGQPTWFWGRQNAFTSSGVARHFSILFRLSKELEEPLPHVAAIHQYLASASEVGPGDEVGLDAGGNEEASDSADEASSNGEGDAGASDANDIDGANSCEDDCKAVVARLASDEGYREEFMNDVRNKEIDTLQGVVKAMGGKAYASVDANAKSIEKWLGARPVERPYVLMSRPQLVDVYKEKFNRSPRTSWGMKDLLSHLSGCARDAEGETEVAASTYVEVNVIANNLPRLKGRARRDARKGHEMEQKYGQDLMEVAKGGISIGGKTVEVLHLFRCGLLQSKDRAHLKDSPDYVAIVRVDGRVCAASVEMKCRCSSATASKERERIQKEGKFVYSDCRSHDLRRHLRSRSEALQCLHHAAALGVDYVLFMVGDCIGLNGGVLIEYDAPIRASCQACIDRMYEEGLKWLCDASVAVPMEEIKAAVSKSRVKIDFNSYMKQVYIWREMLKPQNLPLPPAIRILSMQCQYWNDSKYGSDVKTQAAEMHRALLPFDSRQSKVIDRMLMLIFSDCHSIAKLFSAKEDLSSYPSLMHYRDAGDHRYSMEDILIKSKEAFLKMAEEDESSSRAETEAAVGEGGEPAADSSSSPLLGCVKNVDVLRYTGCTPKKNPLKRYRDSSSEDDEATKRFKECRGRPVLRVGAADLKQKTAGARGYCVGCKTQTNWWCAECHVWACHDKSYPVAGEPNFIRDIRDYWRIVSGRRKRVNGHVVAKHTCFMHFHPKFLLCMPCSS